ncbi:hypothetical protein QJS04_geneDACA005867 [Acorus gramineus]|uniref:Uncharacterized protein n=1 Tax=Acorus gramineus TaxID=55184 RepID=A0AAV9B588_ACOGR|nr:hypothetical protein QJS04_geneDACA005867 [Acorus gramineus]
MAVSKSFTVLLLLLCLLFSSPSSSLARPISDLNLALPKGQIEGSSSSSMESTPCDVDFPDKSSKVIIVEKYYLATTLFNRLPRGRVPPSGPSKGINQNGQ